MNKVRMGIIGIGNMGTGHAGNIVAENARKSSWTAVADINPDRLRWAEEHLPSTVARFDDAVRMMDSGLIDAVIVSVPHYDHPRFAMEGFARGLHVMCEKPAGVYTLQVREMNEAADEQRQGHFGMMFNQRTNCVYRKMKEMVDERRAGRN